MFKTVADGLDSTMSGMSHITEFVILIAENRWRVSEEPVEVLYTEYQVQELATAQRRQHHLRRVPARMDATMNWIPVRLIGSITAPLVYLHRRTSSWRCFHDMRGIPYCKPLTRDLIKSTLQHNGVAQRPRLGKAVIMESHAPHVPAALATPSLNRGLGFTHEKRRRLGLKSRLPSGPRTLKQQANQSFQPTDLLDMAGKQSLRPNAAARSMSIATFSSPSWRNETLLGTATWRANAAGSVVAPLVISRPYAHSWCRTRVLARSFPLAQTFPLSTHSKTPWMECTK
jgi:hypothetical protein